MVTGIKNWSTTAGDNDSPSPNGAPEGMAPSGVNNTIRQNMAEVRAWYENPYWVDFGHSGLTYVDATNFRVSTDLTATYHVGRRIRAIGTTPFTIYGTISASSFSSPNTTITVVWDSGSLDATLSEIAIGPEITNKFLTYEHVIGLYSTTSPFYFKDAGELTISTGVVTPTGVNHTIDTQGDASSDDLDTMSGGSDGRITIFGTDSTRAVNINHDAGNIYSPFDMDLVLFNSGKKAFAIYDDALSKHVVVASNASVPMNYKSGMTLSNNSTDAAHDIDITSGQCSNKNGITAMTLTSAITKRLDASWSVGTGNGGLSSSLTPANNTWYHVFCIVVAGVVDVGFDTSVDAANLIADHSAVLYRRIGSFKTDGSGNVLAFKQSGDSFFWSDPPLDLNATVTTASTTVTLSVPTGVETTALLNAYQTGGSSVGYVFSTFVTEETPSISAAPLANVMGLVAGNVSVLANTSAQVKARTGGSETMRIATLGWREDFAV